MSVKFHSHCSPRLLAPLALGVIVLHLTTFFVAAQSAARVHNERIAGNRAEQFSWALSRNPAFAYELLDARVRAQMPPMEFAAAVTRMFESASPTMLRATHFATGQGQRTLDVFLVAPSGGQYFRFRMSGSGAEGYRVANFTTTEAPASTARPLRPDTGPYQLYAATSSNPQILFVPVAADATLVSAVAETFRQRLQLETKLQAAYVPSARARNSERAQVIGDILAKELASQCRARSSGTGARYLIGVTGEDMYLESQPTWRFALSYRLRPCVAVVSYARMGIGTTPSSEIFHSRLRKMISKSLGALVYGLSLSKDPRSLMFDEIFGVDELDFVEENFDRAGMAPRHLW